MRILAMSSSRSGNSNYLETCLPMIRDFLGEQSRRIVFIPFASLGGYEMYLDKVRTALSSLPLTIDLVEPGAGVKALSDADAVMVGGGNTFKLLHDLYETGLFERIHDKVNAGMPYIGWSVGANLTGKTICTTNDMPIIQPASFNAFGFFPFQINPHYLDEKRENFHGETRDQRISEFVQLRPGIPVIGIPEGTALVLEDRQLELKGSQPAVIFSSQADGSVSKWAIEPGGLLNEVLGVE